MYIYIYIYIYIYNYIYVYIYIYILFNSDIYISMLKGIMIMRNLNFYNFKYI